MTMVKLYICTFRSEKLTGDFLNESVVSAVESPRTGMLYNEVRIDQSL